MTDLIIRSETEEDYLFVSEVKRQAWLQAYSHIFSEEAINNHFDNKLKNHSKNTNDEDDGCKRFVAIKNNKIVATMCIAPKLPDDNFVEILWLYVHPDCQRMGIGKKLYDFAKLLILDQNVKKIHIEALKENHIGCSFYTKTGGMIVSTRTKEMLGKTPELVTFEFDISPVVLETKRLILRNYKETDIDDYFEYASSNDVGPRIGFEPHKTKDSALDRLKLEIEKPFHFAIVWKELNKVVGSIELMNCKTERYSNLKIEPNAKEIGFLLSPDFWGKGIMPEATEAVLNFAFEELLINDVYIGHVSKNDQSKRVQEKLGFKIVGELENYRKWIDGETVSLIERKLTKDDWKIRKNTH